MWISMIWAQGLNQAFCPPTPRATQGGVGEGHTGRGGWPWGEGGEEGRILCQDKDRLNNYFINFDNNQLYKLSLYNQIIHENMHKALIGF